MGQPISHNPQHLLRVDRIDLANFRLQYMSDLRGRVHQTQSQLLPRQTRHNEFCRAIQV